MDTLLKDFRYAWRRLRRTPGFSLVAVATLALGIGATSTIFTVVNGVLLRPLRYRAADRLANIWNDLGEGAQSLPAVSPLDFRDYQTRVDGSPRVAIVDQTLAKMAWPGQNAVGKQLQVQPTGSPDAFVEVVGVVEHMRINDLTRATLPQIYWPIGQAPWPNVGFVIQTSVEPASVAPAVRRVVGELDKDLPVARLVPMSRYVADGMAQSRFSMILMTAFGGIALSLAAIGIFGVISYSVAQRTREFGIRMALGETPNRTRWSVILRGMRLVGLSLGLGLLAALAASRVLAGFLYGVDAGDPLTFAAITAMLSVVALIACYLPARRATSVDPMVALRAE